jgi:hypothetical protein
MPYAFQFRQDGVLVFTGRLQCSQCTATNATAPHNRCRRHVCIGLPYCPTHLTTLLHLKIAPSTIPNSGKGLFAFDRTVGPNTVIFRPGDTICEYHGELITRAQADNRYGPFTAPYAVSITSPRDGRERAVEDAALVRGIGAMPNHFSGNMANAQLVPRYDRARRNNNNGGLGWFTLIAAVSHIRNGEEIFVDYGDEYELGNIQQGGHDIFFETIPWRRKQLEQTYPLL